MCGIAGILDYNNDISSDIIKSMLAKIQYRGPDESGIYIGDNIGIGNVRLSIIDIANGQQPMSNDDRNLWIVYNGEIFNYIELRDELVKLGYKFKTSSDTEVLIKLYEEYKEECLNKLNGQFAFAIWDKEKNELFLARDRVGIRPLYYYFNNNTFVFGSEIKSILQAPDIKAEISPKALSQVFSFWTTITPQTVFKNIYELEPGSYAKVNKNGKKIEKYWSLSYPSSENEYFKGTFDEAKEVFHQLFKDSVKIRLRADVPVAAYLSGGIDSSTTTFYIKENNPNILNTFSIVFEESEFDESRYQDEVSKYLNTNHVGFTCSNRDISEYFPQTIWHTEIPVLRTAPVPMYCLSKNVRQNNIKVVITGEGADELLAGYNIFKETVIREFWAKQPNSRYRPLLLQKLYPYLEQFKGKNAKMLKFFFGYKLTETDLPFYSHIVRWNNTSKILSHFSDEMKSHINNYNPYDDLNNIISVDFKSWDLLSRAQWIETNIFMSGYLLSSQGDRMAMANSVEGRYPFLDHRLVEFCTKLPPDFKLRGLNEKFLLKKLMKDKLPESVINRYKQAYRAPISKSFFNTGSPDYVNELLSEKLLKENGIFNIESVKNIKQKALANAAISELENMTAAGILSTQLLIEFFIKGKEQFSDNNLKNLRIIIDK